MPIMFENQRPLGTLLLPPKMPFGASPPEERVEPDLSHCSVPPPLPEVRQPPSYY